MKVSYRSLSKIKGQMDEWKYLVHIFYGDIGEMLWRWTVAISPFKGEHISQQKL